MPSSNHVHAVLAQGAIAADDVLKLRHRVFWKGVVTEDDAEMVFVLNDRLAHAADVSWPPFFVEALTDYLVFQAEPAGYISEANADWLIARISHSGHVDTASELELLVRVLERAQLSPVRLVTFALQQVKRGVIEGEGYIGHNRKLEPGIINEAETELVRRILYAFGGDGNIAITRQEAEVLFDINDATAQADNHPAWSDLFVKALANFLMAASGYQVPTRQEALRRAAWLDDPGQGVGAFMGQILAGGLDAFRDAFDREPHREANVSPFDVPVHITEEEVLWVAGRIGRDGRPHTNEIALINFLKTHNAHMHPRLIAILDRAA
ncbi:MAG: hypothetical protein AB7I42_14720 [Bradyrhizobium sp.]|uniref:hypothetical protein n=1 Tax=Bradyrhizobium sp. TaxID=376 RepID=UPI003D0F961E